MAERELRADICGEPSLEKAPKTPFFSVIVPVYGVRDYIAECIESVLAQTFGDFELILVDDGSIDGSGEICDEYARKDERIRVIHKANGGLVSARKAGTSVAVGEYVTPIDGDDHVSPEMLSSMVEVLNESRFDVVCCRFYTERVNGDKKVLIENKSQFRSGAYGRNELEKEIYPFLVRGENGVYFSPSLCGKAFARELYKKWQLSIDDDIKMDEDLCVESACLFHAQSIYIVDKRLYYYRYNEASMTKHRTGYPWGDISRARRYLQRNLPQEQFQFGAQIDRTTVHALFRTAWSHLRNDRSYAVAKREILENFSMPEYAEAIRTCRYRDNIKEILATMAVRYRLVFVIKVFAMISPGL